MIYKIVKGRLGNQLFQYAAMRAMQIENFENEELKFYFKYVEKKGKKVDGFENSLKDFNIINDLECFKLKTSLIQKIKIICLISIVFLIKKTTKSSKEFILKRSKIEEKMQPMLNKSGIYWYTNGYYEFDFSSNMEKNKIFYGYFESKRYLKDMKKILQNELKPKYEKLEKNKNLYNVINSTNSICVSIRRGDFVTNPIYKKKHYICDEMYFKKAIDIVKRKVENPIFIVFSDDIDWVKNNMKFPENTYYEDGNDPVWEKLRLMCSCKNFIISNSSFSWWAQYLSENKNKVVIAPNKWIKDEENPDIYDDNWILI